MRIATWNVNSLKARLPRVEEFLGYADVDVLCLQETKLADKAFPALTFSALGYESVHYGQGQWNGVAILSRVGIADRRQRLRRRARRSLRRRRPRPRRRRAAASASSACTCRTAARSPTEFYDRKLRVARRRMHDWIDATHTPDDPLVVLGDFNVAPEDRDVWDPKKFVGATHVTEPERKAVAAPRGVGHSRTCSGACTPTSTACSATGTTAPATSTSTAACASTSCSATPPVAERVTWAVVDRNARKGTGPSDHAPVIVDLRD